MTGQNPYALCKRKGCGDKIETLLRWLRIRPRCGSCQRRKNVLNEIDRYLYRFLRGPRDAKYTVP
jgi:hypothetical protein